MKHLFSIKDEKSSLNHYFIANSNADAIRSFITAVNDENSQYHKFSEDFTLYHVAILDETSLQGSVIDIQKLGGASEYLKQKI